jgi:hypothetical protein
LGCPCEIALLGYLLLDWFSFFFLKIRNRIPIIAEMVNATPPVITIAIIKNGSR